MPASKESLEILTIKDLAEHLKVKETLIKPAHDATK